MRTLRSRRVPADKHTIDELRRRLALDGPPSAERVSWAPREGKVLVVLDRANGDYVASMEGVAEVPVFGKGRDGRQTVLFRLEVEVLVDETRERLRRGRQTIIPLPDGPEPTAALLQRQANLGTAWKHATELATVTDHPKAAAARARRASRLTSRADECGIARDVTLAGRAAGASERQINSEIQAALAKHRGASVTMYVARRRKSQAGMARS